ncbi:MAG: hypothetical protein HY329_23075 [Chloroflexi bacterium]|nr:hypothetical protein [Chloroflexota bacterium]
MAQDARRVTIQGGKVGDGVVVEVEEVVALMVVGDGAAEREPEALTVPNLMRVE